MMKKSKSRRRFLQQTLASTISLSLTSLTCSAKSRKKPNVLFIVADDLNDWIGCMDTYPLVKTPNLDRLANKGVLFTNAFCNAPACNPSRKSFLSGLRPSTTGLYYNKLKIRDVKPDAITLPQHFLNNGYYSLGGGKIFHTSTCGDEKSWDEYLDLVNSPELKPYPYPKVSDHHYHRWGPLDIGDEEMKEDYRTVTWASEFLAKDHDNPFFLGVGFFKPHHPWVVPRKYFDMYPMEDIVLPKVKKDDVDDLPPYGRYFADKREPQLLHRKIIEKGQWKLAIQAYLATITYMDTQLGRLLDSLQKSAYADNTVIVFFSDNGMHMGEKNHWTKWGLWDQSTKVPLIISAPGIKSAECAEPVSLIDVYPTLSDLCQLPDVDYLEGHSMLPQLRNPDKPRKVPVITTHGQNNHTIRTKHWRYIRYRDGSEELYDHQNDPYEWYNLAEDAEYDQIKKELRAWLPKVNVPDVDYKEKKKYWPGDPTIK